MAKYNFKSAAWGAFWLASLAGFSSSVQAQVAQLTPGQIGDVTAAVGLPVGDAVLALQDIFAANPGQVIAFAEEATRQAPALCEQIMTESTRVAPDQIGDLAAAILALAPECEEQIAGILAEGVTPAAGPGPLAQTGPIPSPISSPSSTAENPATDVASPTTP